MKNIIFFLSENFQFLDVTFPIYLNRRVFVMDIIHVVMHFFSYFYKKTGYEISGKLSLKTMFVKK